MYITRTVEDDIIQNLGGREVIIVYGPRQTGKSTLLSRIREKTGLTTLAVNADLTAVQRDLSSQNLETLRSFVGDHELIMIDEAQRVPNIGINLKIIHDEIPGVKIIATGSSSFDLANKIREPLTGRTRTYRLYPVSLLELSAKESHTSIEESLEQYLQFGMYPALFSLRGADQKVKYLEEVVEANLYRDILELENIRSPKMLKDLLRLLALQIGSEVSVQELATSLGAGKNTIKRYLDLLEKAFIIYRLDGFSRNLRKEVTKSSKYYFIDVGVRNTVINNFNPLAMRTDTGALWENFLFMERLKRQAYLNIRINCYFWRTYDQKEIDLIEEREGKLFAYEFKLSAATAKKPTLFLNTYPGSQYSQVNRENFRSFVS